MVGVTADCTDGAGVTDLHPDGRGCTPIPRLTLCCRGRSPVWRSYLDLAWCRTAFWGRARVRRSNNFKCSTNYPSPVCSTKIPSPRYRRHAAARRPARMPVHRRLRLLQPLPAKPARANSNLRPPNPKSLAAQGDGFDVTATSFFSESRSAIWRPFMPMEIHSGAPRTGARTPSVKANSANSKRRPPLVRADAKRGNRGRARQPGASSRTRSGANRDRSRRHVLSKLLRGAALPCAP